MKKLQGIHVEFNTYRPFHIENQPSLDFSIHTEMCSNMSGLASLLGTRILIKVTLSIRFPPTGPLMGLAADMGLLP